jgi:hypothetical protein
MNNNGSSVIDPTCKPGSAMDFNIHYPDFTSWPVKSQVFEAHSLFGVDPLFVNPSADDFRLQAGSPAIGRGITIPDFIYDKSGNVRTVSWDIGAYKYGAAADTLPSASPSTQDTTPPAAPKGLLIAAIFAVVHEHLRFIITLGVLLLAAWVLFFFKDHLRARSAKQSE